MIILKNLNKYFNKNRSNEIHVINDISLTLPDKGLVVLLGPSGSGKTTLLNVLGGLDKVQKGIIDYDGEVLGRYNANKWDDIRNENIGYIFQNYNLIHDLSVYENIAITLNMVGIYDQEEIDTRINYILSKIGMQNYRRRRASQLSGGQQQRVAIARALAKNPKVIIADEPTGNLDSKNTYDIMNIIKSISNEKLVVLVTHERHLAREFADRIIELEDGQIISDRENLSTGALNKQLETDIYLSEYNKVEDYKKDNVNYQVFTDEENDASFNVRLIVRNKTLYVEVDSDKYKRINLLDHNSEVQIFDEDIIHEEKELLHIDSFDLDTVINEDLKTERTSAFNIKDSIKLGLRRFRDATRGVKFINVMFMVISGFIALAIALIFNVFHLDATDFMQVPVETITVNKAVDFSYEDALLYEEEGIGYINIFETQSFIVDLPIVYQSTHYLQERNFNGLPVEYLDESDIVEGRMISGHNEIVMTKQQALSLINNNYDFQNYGITRLKDLITLEITYKVLGLNGLETEIKANIVGIADVDNPVIYATEETLIMMSSGFAVYEAYEDVLDKSYTIEEEQFIVLDTANDSNVTTLRASVFNTFFDGQEEFSTDDNTVPELLFKKEHLREAKFNITPTIGGMNVITSNKDETIDYFENLDFETVNVYEINKAQARSYNIDGALGTLTFAAVFIGASTLATFFILRSSLLSRIYEVSVYRALGAKKRDLRKLFLIETLILTTLTSLVGYLLVSFVLYRIQTATEGFFTIVEISPLSFITGIGIIYLVNIISGLLPISSLLRSTPSQIMSRYDF